MLTTLELECRLITYSARQTGLSFSGSANGVKGGRTEMSEVDVAPRSLPNKESVTQLEERC